MTRGPGRLEAPHRRVPRPPRIVERTGLAVYRGASWLISRLPVGLSIAVIGTVAQASYLAWPRKRAWSNANFAHVLELPPDDPRVRRMALRAYRAYARYLVELMRLPRVTPEAAATMLPDADIEQFEAIWRGHDGPLIIVFGHIGNNDAVAAALGSRGWPVSVVADDTAFPELFAYLAGLRARWHVKIVPWRNLRQIFGVLRNHEMLALLTDWGYRADGIPVRLGDAWTALPAGPATLAGKFGALIVPVAMRRRDDGHFHAEIATPFTVASTEPAELARATQRIADELLAAVRAAPEQWYSFKPVWPATVAEQDVLAARAAAMLDPAGSSRRLRAGAVGSGGAGAGVGDVADAAGDGADAAGDGEAEPTPVVAS